jgi:hypothetical protein
LRERREARAAVEVEEELVRTRVEACGGEREEA